MERFVVGPAPGARSEPLYPSKNRFGVLLPRYLALILCLCTWVYSAHAGECDERDGYAAEVLTDYLDSWKNVARFYKQFKNCDNGGVAEGVSDAIARLLANQWQHLADLLVLASKEQGLEAFVLSHLDETDDSADLNRIAALSRTQCPPTATLLCSKFISRIDSLGHGS